jgi:uncharacterized membrane protein YuzA (DUF378 family)
MLRYYYINKEWMVSGTAQHVYRVTASLSFVLFFMLMALRLMGEIPNGLLPIVKFLLLAGVLGTATTMVAMEYFLFGFDSFSATKKVFWFCVMLFPPLGPALYCFLVYLRSDVLKNYAKRVEGPSA